MGRCELHGLPVLVLALLSPDYFTSKFCRGELEGAKAAGVPIVPVFSGDHYTRKSIIDLMEQKSDPEKEEAVKAAFGQNLIDINNGDHAETVNTDIREKIVGRFLAEAAPEGSPRSRTESHRIEWVEYYVRIGAPEKAYELGWDGLPFEMD